MEQIRIGKFISELRREKEMTQTELADTIGVSAKTVSKWETGRGLPEISTLTVLCDTLGISVNELLSGERFAADSYTEHAEENMVTLLKDSKSYNKDRSVIAVAVPIIAVVALIILILSTWGQGMYIWYIDLPSFLFMFLTVTVFLLAEGGYADLWRAFVYVAGFGVPVREKIECSIIAVGLTGKTLLASGALLSFISVITVFVASDTMLDDAYILLSALTVAVLPVFYGLAGYLMSLPIKARLEKRIIKIQS